MRFVSVLEHHDHHLRIYHWSPEGDMRDEYFSQLPCLGTGASCMFVGVMTHDPYLGIEIFIFPWGFWGSKGWAAHRWVFLFHPKRSLRNTVVITSMFFATKYNYLRMWWQLKYFFSFSPPTWGWWTHFDEHIFQMGWFNHQLAKNVAGGCLFLEQNKPFFIHFSK